MFLRLQINFPKSSGHHSLNVYFNHLKRCILICYTVISTNSRLNVISRWLRELLAEPRRVVELTASTSAPHP